MINEKRAAVSLLTPSSIPIKMVEPERDRPGKIAPAWAQPMSNDRPLVILPPRSGRYLLIIIRLPVIISIRHTTVIDMNVCSI